MCSFISRIFKGKKKDQEVINWEKEGCPAPPPHTIKREAIQAYKKAYSLETLIETGTFMGDMVEAQRKKFRTVISIELDTSLYQKAKERFSKASNVKILNGDSGEVIEGIVKELNSKALFWLDGHYSSGITAKGVLNTPIIKELTYVLSSKIDHVVLIDDARLFVGKEDYPSLSELEKFIKGLRPDYSFEVKDDMIRLFKSSQKKA
jgi:hypothetical protein